ncbi:MAG: hypothetical protein A2132_06635 [Nitrospirae bacterium RBG_16_43_11]|nr:MAG: hypothetical protein A2132_06635 [Nitrospirae bacterium RBG_16_43_11]
MKTIKHLTILTILTIFILILPSCTKKEQPQPPPPEQQSMMPAHGDIEMPASEDMKVIIPDAIKGKWKGVILTVIDKQTANTKDYNIPIGGKVAISGSNIEVQTGDFLPDLKIEGNIYSSDSTQLLNPAIHVEIKEGGKEVFKGWLFQKFPSVHPFKHERFSITLKEPVSAL